jgi:lipopolysaccharide export system protein LptA
MRVSIERLRRWLLAGAGLLVLVIAGFLLYAHYRAHRLLTDLPRRLGMDIRQEANGYTYSQTMKGGTVFTLHAAKAIQHKDGKYTLHDVAITVYGKGEEQGKASGSGASQGQKRVDHISGKEFELDQAAGVVKAMGEVHLDLEAPSKEQKGTAADQTATAAHGEMVKDAQLIHVKTSGIVYLQKLGVAATDQPIEFEYNGMNGHAKGADYNSDSGLLVLHEAVNVSGLQHGDPVVLTASRAELNRTNREITLADSKYVTVNDSEGGRSRQVVEAKHAVVLMRKDGSAERMNGEGGVAVTMADGARLTAERGEALLNEDNKPQALHMRGAVRYSAEDAQRQAHGEATEARVGFDAQGHAKKVVLTDAVHMQEKILPIGKTGATERELTAGGVELALGTNAAGGSWIRDAKATGHARLKVTDAESVGKGQRTSLMQANILTAHLELEGGRPALRSVDGDGDTLLDRRAGDGLVETSSGDTLHATFHSAAGAADRGTAAGAREALDRAIQQGHVVATRSAPAKAGQPAETDHAIANQALYEGSAQRTTLTGAVALESTEGTLWADRVVMEQKTGDAVAEGSVKTSYRQGSGETVHVLADRADLKKAENTAVFRGAAGRRVRLWQNGSQIEAPVLVFDRKQRRLAARGEGEGAAMAVRTVLVSAGSQRATGSSKGDAQTASDKSGQGKDALRRPAVVRIGSREMVYSDEARTAQFTGGVRVESADGVMSGQQATAYLAPAQAKKGASKDATVGTDFMGGAVERVLVNGGIEIDQTGRRAVGEHLVYTASDGVFVLTGAEGLPPKVMDAAQGTITGRELRFREQDESVVISNGDAAGTGSRVRTETRVKRER